MTINYSAIFKHSWVLFKNNLILVISLVLALLLFSLFRGYVNNLLGGGLVGFIASVLIWAAYVFLQVGMVKILLNLADGKEAKIKQLWSYPQYFVQALLVTFILIGIFLLFQLLFALGLFPLQLASILSLVVLIIELYIFCRLLFSIYYVVDKNMKAVDAIKASWERTKGSVLNIFIFLVIIVVLNILGAIAFLVGLLVTLPISMIAITLLYRKFSD